MSSDPRAAVDADEMTYQQLMDVMNMVVTDTLPASNSADDYDIAVGNSSSKGSTTLTYDGKLQFEDANNGTSKATIALYDSSSDNFNLNVDSNGDGTADSYTSSAMTFNTNNAITIRDPKTDFFATLDEVIKSVENHKLYPDSESGDIRNVGIENAIAMMDDLQNHIGRSHSKVGAQSNALSNSLERNQTLEISTMSLRSSVIDTDLAEASLTLSQLQLNYQAMLSTVGKVSQLSLVNYL
jgi:flagellar hook-associated protein 3 FlgL